VDAIKEGDKNDYFKYAANYLGDQQVPWLPGVDRIYLASPTRGELYAADKSGPVLDSSTVTGYKIFGTFNTKLTGTPYPN